MEGELEADDYYNSMPGESHPFHKAPSLTGRDSRSVCEEGMGPEEGRGGVDQELLSARKLKFLKLPKHLAY